MKMSSLMILAALAWGGAAVAQEQTQVQGGAAADSQTSVSAGRDGASATSSGSAAASAESDQAAAALAGGTELNAKLSKPVDVRRNKPGDEVTATLTQDVESEGRVVIARGSKLIGRVTQAQPRGEASGSGSGESQLGIVFDRAVLKDGSEVPVHAAVQAIGSARAAASGRLRDSDASMMGAGSAAGSGRAAGGALGGVGGGIGGVGGVAGGVTGGVSGTVGSSVGATTRTVGSSAGAVGGFNAAGALSSGSKGVFGMPGLDIGSAAAGSAQGSVITSATRNVRLDSGTRMLLVAGAGASAAR